MALINVKQKEIHYVQPSRAEILVSPQPEMADPRGLRPAAAGLRRLCGCDRRGGFGAIKSSDVYTQALERAKSSEEVQAALGTPVEDGWFVSGSINISGSSGDADFAIPLSGPNGSATSMSSPRSRRMRWRFSTLDVAVKDSADRIDLLANSDGSIREYASLKPGYATLTMILSRSAERSLAFCATDFFALWAKIGHKVCVSAAAG